MLNPLKWLRSSKSTGPRVDGRLTGRFELRGDRIAGFVPPSWIDKSAQVEIRVYRYQTVILRIPAPLSPHGHRFEFLAPINGAFDPAELIDGRVTVSAFTADGDSGELLLDGAGQLELIRRYLGAPAIEVFNLDMTAGNDTSSYLVKGWYGALPTHTWTHGSENLIRFATPSHVGKYALRASVGGFIHAPEVTRQDADIFVDDAFVGVFSVNLSAPQFCEVRFPSEVFGAGPTSLIRFRQHFAARAGDFNNNSKDGRILAMGFRNLALVHLLESHS